jgi:hypothetical protein
MENERNIYPTSQNPSDSTKDFSFLQNFSQQKYIPANTFDNIKASKKNLLYNENISSANKTKQSSEPQDTTNRKNANINLNMNSKDVIGEINQNKKNQIEFQRKKNKPYYNIQKPVNFIFNKVPSECTNLNRPYQSMSFNQKQLLDLVFHYQNMIDNINKNMSIMNNKMNLNEFQLNLFQQDLYSTKLDLYSTKQDLYSTKQELITTQEKLNSTEQKLNSTEQKLNSTQQELNSTRQELKSTKQELDIRINKTNEVIKQMNDKYTKDISKIKSDFLILNEKINLSAENENVCLNSINKILIVLDNILNNTNDINKYLVEEKKKNSQDIILLKKEVEMLKSKVKEL